MQKNFHLDAYEVDAVTQRNKSVRFDITDGCNGKYLIHTEHDEVYVSKDSLLEAMRLIGKKVANGQSSTRVDWWILRKERITLNQGKN